MILFFLISQLAQLFKMERYSLVRIYQCIICSHVQNTLRSYFAIVSTYFAITASQFFILLFSFPSHLFKLFAFLCFACSLMHSFRLCGRQKDRDFLNRKKTCPKRRKRRKREDESKLELYQFKSFNYAISEHVGRFPSYFTGRLTNFGEEIEKEKQG